MVPVSFGGGRPSSGPRAACRARTTGVHTNPSRLHLDVEVLGKRVDHRHADAVEAAGHLVAAALAELAAGVENGQHDLDRGRFSFSMTATGIPRPLSTTVTELSGWIATSTSVQ